METMTINKATQSAVDTVVSITKHIVASPIHKLLLDYDEEADVLYISLQRPPKATDSIMLDDMGILLSYRGEQLVGITVFEASKC
jgi:uncharacterized protein YuzE